MEIGLLVLSRTYLTPLVEKLEHKIQRLAIWLSLRNRCCEKMFYKVLKKQLLVQMSIQNITELNQFNFWSETGEGLEALMSSAI